LEYLTCGKTIPEGPKGIGNHRHTITGIWAFQNQASKSKDTLNLSCLLKLLGISLEHIVIFRKLMGISLENPAMFRKLRG